MKKNSRLSLLVYCLCIIVCSLSGCSHDKNKLSFASEEYGFEVRSLTFEDSTPLIEHVGTLDPEASELVIKNALINATFKRNGNYDYVYSLPIDDITKKLGDTAVFQGVLVYWGNVYFVVEKDKQYLYPLNMQSGEFENCISYDDFLSKAIKYNKKYNDTQSGGTGLLE